MDNWNHKIFFLTQWSVVVIRLIFVIGFKLFTFLKKNAETDTDEKAVGFDENKFQSDEFQRPYHYLLYYESKHGNIPIFNTENKEKNKKRCLQVLLRWVNTFSMLKNPVTLLFICMLFFCLCSYMFLISLIFICNICSMSFIGLKITF